MFWIFQNLFVFRAFLKKQCFWKMGMAGIKQGPRPSTTPWFLVNLNEEGLLKVSFKSIAWFQICTFSKTTAFSKKGPKHQKNFEKLEIFFAILVAIL